MKRFYHFCTIATLSALITSCGQGLDESSNMINTVGEVRTNRDAFFNQQDLMVLNRICSAMREKDNFFDTYFIDKNRAISTGVVTKECQDQAPKQSKTSLRLVSHLSRIVYTDQSGSSQGEFFSEYESLKTGVVSELCRSLEQGGQVSSVVRVQGSSFMQWYYLSEDKEKCFAENSACLFIELGAKEANATGFKVQQNERITFNMAKGPAYGFPILRERIDNAFCNSPSEYRLLKNTYSY